MSHRYDVPLIAGAHVHGDAGLGVLGSEVPVDGEHGGGIASTWLAPEDLAKEVRVLITSWPETGTLFVHEDTSFEYDGPSTSFSAQLYVTGQPIGTPQPITLTIGSAPVVLAPSAGLTETAGHVPGISQPRTVAPSAGRAELYGNAPAVMQGDAQVVQPSVGRSELIGNAPGIGQPITLSPGAGRADLAGHAPTVSQIATVRPGAGRVALLGIAPGIAQPLTITPAVGMAETSGHAPIVVQGITVNPISGRVDLSGRVPGITQGGAVTLSPSAGRIELLGGVPTVSTGAADIDWSLRRRSVFVRVSRHGTVLRTETQRASVRI